MPIENTAYSITLADRDLLRRLAQQVAALAARPIEAEKRERWYRHNALEHGRAMVICDPENGWGEIILEAELQCTGGLARDWEQRLLKEIWWGSEMNDDRVVTGIFDVGLVTTETGWGLQEIKHGGGDGNAYSWDAPLQDLDDLSALRYPTITVQEEASAQLLALAQETLGGIIPVRQWQTWWWSLGLTWQAIKLRGLEQFMLDMYDNPEGLHNFMAILRDGTMARIDMLQDNGLLCLNNGGNYVGSGGFGWSHELPAADNAGKVRTQDMWGFAESQETVSVRPEMFGEFVFPYQLPILERFGLNCYGCCEPIHSRWHIVKQIPRLRRVSVSPWCDVPAMAEMLGDNYILSIKPNPTMLAAITFDADAVRADIREKLEQTRGCHVEFIMKDNNTINNDPHRVKEWVRIAQEETLRMG